MVWTVLFLGFAVILMSLALDGLGMAVTYRRAVGLATAGAQAGAGVLAEFDGGAVTLNGDACHIALNTVQANLNHDTQHAKVTCQQQGNSVAVTVELQPLRVIGGPLALVLDHVRVTAKANPRYGINQVE